MRRRGPPIRADNLPEDVDVDFDVAPPNYAVVGVGGDDVTPMPGPDDLTPVPQSFSGAEPDVPARDSEVVGESPQGDESQGDESQGDESQGDESQGDESQTASLKMGAERPDDGVDTDDAHGLDATEHEAVAQVDDDESGPDAAQSEPDKAVDESNDKVQKLARIRLKSSARAMPAPEQTVEISFDDLDEVHDLDHRPSGPTTAEVLALGSSVGE